MRRIVGELDRLDRERARFLAAFAYVLSRVAAADLDLGDTVLSAAATLSFPGAGEPDGQYLLLSPVEAAGSTHWRLVGLGSLVDERLVGRKPSSIGFAEAAALPLTSITAWEMLL